MKDKSTIPAAASRACKSHRVLCCQVIVDSSRNRECDCHWHPQHHYKQISIRRKLGATINDPNPKHRNDEISIHPLNKGGHTATSQVLQQGKIASQLRTDLYFYQAFLPVSYRSAVNFCLLPYLKTGFLFLVWNL